MTAAALKKIDWPLGPPTGGVVKIRLHRIARTSGWRAIASAADRINSSRSPRLEPRLIRQWGTGGSFSSRVCQRASILLIVALAVSMGGVVIQQCRSGAREPKRTHAYAIHGDAWIDNLKQGGEVRFSTFVSLAVTPCITTPQVQKFRICFCLPLMWLSLPPFCRCAASDRRGCFCLVWQSQHAAGRLLGTRAFRTRLTPFGISWKSRAG